MAASSLYGVGRRADAQAHMNAAQSGYAQLTNLVRAKDAVLDREINAAFGIIAGQISANEAPPQVTNRMGLMQGQLLTPRSPTRWTCRRAATRRSGPRCSSTWPSRATPPTPPPRPLPATPAGRRAFQDAFGLLTRVLAIARNLKGSLGPQAGAAAAAAGAAHNDGFPLGVLEPKTLQPAKVTADLARLRAAVARRFDVR